MGGYGKAAVKAVKRFVSGDAGSPKGAWDKAIIEFYESKSCREKGCPKAAFLGLCKEGMVRGIPAGSYTSSQFNKAYAVEAVRILQGQSALSSGSKGLWDKVMLSLKNKGLIDKEGTSHNGQMDVVVSLWNASLIVV